MGKFNLLYEPWILVVDEKMGEVKDVSLKEIFQNAHLYKGLAGDTRTQDFAILRVLLAVLHTVFSRFDADGQPYSFIKLDERFRQITKVGKDYEADYKEELLDTWYLLWEKGQFPDIICDYLEKWSDRFNLLDDKYPFFQVLEEDISGNAITIKNATRVSGKNINRLISESENKVALFAPKAASTRECLTYAEISRWLITFQGYTGAFDKAKFSSKYTYKPSKGWLFDLGGVFIEGDNLFDTLMLNFFITQDEGNNLLNIQKPCWEYSSNEIIKNYFLNYFDTHSKEAIIDNIAGLYTAWSRGIHINPEIKENTPFSCNIVKLPNIVHRDNFIEPMTLWKYNERGDNKNHTTPIKHRANKAFWRSFGLISGEQDRKPGVIQWLEEISRGLADCENNERYKLLSNLKLNISAISMQDDGNATSWVPTDEVIDYISVDGHIMTDIDKDRAWVSKINEIVDYTQHIVDKTYGIFINDIKEIRNISEESFNNHMKEELYSKINKPFIEWLADIHIDDEKEATEEKWKKILFKLVLKEAKEVVGNSNFRDYKGISEKKDSKGNVVKLSGNKNIATAYNALNYYLNKVLKGGGNNAK